MIEYRLRIVQDDLSENPNDSMDSPAFLLADHRDFAPKAPKGWSLDRARDLVELQESGTSEESDCDRFVVFPLFAYIHSGVSLSMGRSYPFNDHWDSGQIGYVVVDLDGVCGKIDRANAEEVARGWVETWNQYLSGDVWGYEVSRIDTCSLGHEHAEVVDSCWGFYGKEYCEQEGKGVLESYQKENAA